MAETFPNVKMDIIPEIKAIFKHQENIYKEMAPRVIIAKVLKTKEKGKEW